MLNRLLGAALLVFPFLAACKTGVPFDQGEHWGVDSMPDRIVHRFLGYRAERDGKFIDFQYQKKKDVNLTLRRHFLNNSPDNPFQADDPSRTKARPAHTLLPDPLYYIGAEGIVMGFAIKGIWGVYLPIPVDSVIATVFGGWGELFRGFGKNARTPPGVSSFRVKNR